MNLVYLKLKLYLTEFNKHVTWLSDSISIILLLQETHLRTNNFVKLL